MDDTVLAKVNASQIYLVLNAGCVDKDLAHIDPILRAFQAQGKDVKLHEHRDRGLLALQGPKAAQVLQPLCPALDLSTFYFGNFTTVQIAGAECFLTRTGYTGEDGTKKK